MYILNKNYCFSVIKVEYVLMRIIGKSPLFMLMIDNKLVYDWFNVFKIIVYKLNNRLKYWFYFNFIYAWPYLLLAYVFVKSPLLHIINYRLYRHKHWHDWIYFYLLMITIKIPKVIEKLRDIIEVYMQIYCFSAKSDKIK